MKKKELEIVALQSSVTHMHSYAVVLGEVNGTRKIPIVIGGFEAQAIAVALENLQPKRPLTHDLMAVMLDTFEVSLIEVLIYRLEEGIFYAKLICLKGGDTFEIDCRTSDAISLAIRMKCPIFAYQSIIDAASLEITDGGADGGVEEDMHVDIEQELEAMEVNELAGLDMEALENLLNEVTEQEDYVRAIKIRDEINKRKS